MKRHQIYFACFAMKYTVRFQFFAGQTVFLLELRNNLLFFFLLKDFKEAACDKNEAKNISLLYNLPGVAGPSGVTRPSAGNGAIPKVNCAKIQKNGGKTGVSGPFRERREHSNERHIQINHQN